MKSKIFRIDVDSESYITSEVYETVVESLLKYILYQYQQIPLPIDVLKKEVENWINKSNSIVDNSTAGESTDNNSCDTDLTQNGNKRTYLQQKAQQRRDEVSKRTFERKRQRWLLKVQNMVKEYERTMDILKDEVNKNVIKSTIFAIGPSPLTSKYVFRIHAPCDPKSKYFKGRSCPGAARAEDSLTSISKRKILLSLFRAFASNSDVATFSSLSLSASKLWTLVEKESPLPHLGEEPPSPMGEDFLPQRGTIPREEFKIAPRAQVIEVFLKEPKLVEMELTPCLGVGICGKVGGRSSLLKADLFSSYDSDDDLGIEPLQPEARATSSFLRPFAPTPHRATTPFTHGKTPHRATTPFTHGRTPHHPTTPFTHRMMNIEECVGRTPVNFRTPRQEHRCSDAMVETPLVTRLVSTPSPVKRLALGISECDVTPRLSKELSATSYNWHQIEQPIKGFKDFCLAKSS